MTTQISSDNIQPATLAAISPVTITSITVTDSSWTPLDDSAVSTSGGYIVITGTNFASGCNVIISSTNATSVAFVNSTTLRVQVPAKSAGTYVVYVTNTNGTTAIIVNGLTYSGTPTWVTESPLPQGTTGVAISIQLSATGDTPLTYELQAGSTLPDGLSLSSSGLLSGTVSGLTVETTYNFTILAIDPESQDSPKAFAITIIAGDQYWDYVTLLLPGTTSTSIFNDDASTNNFPITVAGDTKPNNFNPYTPGYYSNYFDGNGDYFTVAANTAFDFGTGDFTIEAWVYPISNGQNYPTFLGSVTGWSAGASGHRFNNTGYANKFWFGLNGSGGIASGDPFMASTNTFSFNTWHHYAVTRSGNTFRMFVNGVLENTQTFSGSYNAGLGGLRSGWSTWDGVNGYFTGYTSNLRLVKGTAVYTANFTPSTTPLTAIANTSLLTCQSNRFIDNSTNNFAITVSGNTSINSFDPFIPNTSYSSYGSTYFDGTGDYLTVPSNSAFALGTGDFTIECWIYVTVAFGTSGSGRGALISNRTVISSGTSYTLQHYNGKIYFGTPSVDIIVGGTTMSINRWYHVAITRSSGTVRLFLNGTSDATPVTGNTTNFSDTSSVAIGCDGSYLVPLFPYTGYMSEVRIVKGTAVYTSAFTPSTTPLTAVSGTSLLTLQYNQPINNSTFLDNSTSNFLVTRLGNTTQGTFSPYAENWSNYFDGGTNRLTTAGSSAFNLTGTSLTLECWVYMTAAPSVNNRLITIGPNGSQSSLSFAISTSRLLDVGVPFGSGGSVNSGANLVPLNTWTHLAFVLSGSTGTLYINGTQVGQTSSWNITSSNSNYFYIGYDATATVDGKFTGYVSNVRLVRGTAVYTGAFTPSTTPLQPIAGTSILTCKDPNFVDDSANRFALSMTGSVRVQKFGPFAGTTLPTPYYGAYFDGTNDYLTIPATANLAVQSNDFTLECWVYLSAASAAASADAPFYTSVTAAGYVAGTFWFGKHSATSGKVTVFIYNYSSSTYLMTEPTLPPADQWTHYALVRSGSTYTIYRNGVATVTATFAGATTGATSSAWIGRSGDSGGPGLTGYLSNMRLVNGTAVYTANFTPSTQPLTAITNTSLLTCQSATFVDNSTNNFTITAAGNSQPTFFNPFTVTYSTLQSYSPSVFGGSMYFDGAGDYLVVPNNPVLNFGNRSWTAEMWIYPSGNYTTYNTLFAKRNHASLCAYEGYLSPTNGYLGYYNGTLYTSTATPVTNAWSHVAYVFNGTNIQIYLNGVLVLNRATTNADQAVDLYIGMYNLAGTPYDYYFGYMAGFRLMSGATYTSNFAPPAAPVLPVQNTVLLLNGTSAATIDVTSNNNLETVADAKLSTAVSKWSGTTGMYFDGTGDYCFLPKTQSFLFGSGDFTIELWTYISDTTTRKYILGPGTDDPSHYDGFGLEIWGQQLCMWASSNGTSWNMLESDTSSNRGSTLMAANTWYNIAVTRSGNTFRSFVNGVVEKTFTVAGTIFSDPNIPYNIGRSGYATGGYFYYNGYMNDVRITLGYARYTGNFSVPTSPFLTN